MNEDCAKKEQSPFTKLEKRLMSKSENLTGIVEKLNCIITELFGPTPESEAISPISENPGQMGTYNQILDDIETSTSKLTDLVNTMS